ncbi:MAG: right-handed parallel beta-helix repeat-containing protein [Candidatus Thorarchaeota archaeon]|nr:MAG: right-handed parallel beta-helix repeat-containing protein [Candidatus Thorarchaeota archaeon]
MTLRRYGQLVVIMILLTLPSILIFAGDNPRVFTEPRRAVSGFGSSHTFTPHDAIQITSDEEFATTASSEGWPGDGTAERPYVISGLLLSDPSIQPLRIWNTQVHWVFNNNIVESGAVCGIWVDNTINGVIRNNTVRNRHSGVILQNAQNLTVTENVIHGNTANGIEVLGSLINSTIIGNNIYDNADVGMYIPAAIDSTIVNNTVAENGGNGITITICTRNIVSNNIVESNGGFGMFVGASNSLIEGNSIIESGDDGMTLISGSMSEILDNTLESNEGYGVSLSGSVRNVTVTLNEFIGNVGDSQVCDHGIGNEFCYNYYDSWTSPDVDSNEIVDEPYLVDGSAENSDPYPLASPNAEIPDMTTTTTTSTTPTPPDGTVDLLPLIGGIALVALVGIVVVAKRRA